MEPFQTQKGKKKDVSGKEEAASDTDASEAARAEGNGLTPAQAARLDAIAARREATPAQVALNWVICKGAVPIPGARTKAQAVENCGAAGWRLLPEDVQALDADFFVFSGHKAFGPTGIGALVGKEAWLEKLPPYQGGGDMIETVSFSGSTWADLPSRFEAGTPNMAGAIGLAAAARSAGRCLVRE